MNEQRVRELLTKARQTRDDNALPDQRVHAMACCTPDEMINLCATWLSMHAEAKPPFPNARSAEIQRP